MKTFASQESIPVGCVPSAAVTIGGVPARGEGSVPAPGGVHLPGVCTCREVYLPGGGGCTCPEGVPARGGAYPSMH